MVSRRDAVKLGTAGLFAPLVGSFGPASAFATQSGDVPTTHGTAATQSNLGPRIDAPIVVKWRLPMSAMIRNAPVIADPVAVVVDTDGLVQAFDLATGTERWSASATYPYVAAPAETDGMVFLASVGQDGATIQAFATETGDEHWRTDRDEGPAQSQSTIAAGYGAVFTKSGRDLLQLAAATGDELGRWPDVSAPTVVDDTLFVRGMMPTSGQQGPVLIAYELKSGAQRWAIPFSSSPYVRNDIALGDGRAYATSGDNILHAFDAATGEEIWQYARGEMTGTAARFGSGLVFADTGSGFLALDAKTGAERWSQSSSSLSTSLTVADGVIYRTESNGLTAFDAATGTEIWSYPVESGATLGGGTVLLVGDEMVALGNVPASTVIRTTSLRDSPSSLGIERGTVATGDTVYSLGTQENEEATTWLKVSAAGTTGWLPLDAIDPATLPDGASEYVYIPQ